MFLYKVFYPAFVWECVKEAILVAENETSCMELLRKAAGDDAMPEDQVPTITQLCSVSLQPCVLCIYILEG